jgi:hypothetical protein
LYSFVFLKSKWFREIFEVTTYIPSTKLTRIMC